MCGMGRAELRAMVSDDIVEGWELQWCLKLPESDVLDHATDAVSFHPLEVNSLPLLSLNVDEAVVVGAMLTHSHHLRALLRAHLH